tara:strand:- start:297 stop:869 length:573 start_codon:yes stop_codon:yes gene_type:complete
MRQLLASFGIFGLYGIGAIFLFAFIIVFIRQKQQWDKTDIHFDYLLLMTAESAVWALCLYFLLSNILVGLMNPIGKSIIQQVTLAIGAGIYEEFLFRVLLIYGLNGILGFIFQWSVNIRRWGAMIVAAGIFSAFHFIGEYGDYFSLDLFFLRFFAGLVLGIVYFVRGFGITAYAHSIYDLIVLTQLTTRY